MKIELRRISEFSWSVYVDDVLMIERESHVVASNVIWYPPEPRALRLHGIVRRRALDPTLERATIRVSIYPKWRRNPREKCPKCERVTEHLVNVDSDGNEVIDAERCVPCGWTIDFTDDGPVLR